jgi:hypothetical protein
MSKNKTNEVATAAKISRRSNENAVHDNWK